MQTTTGDRSIRRQHLSRREWAWGSLCKGNPFLEIIPSWSPACRLDTDNVLWLDLLRVQCIGLTKRPISIVGQGVVLCELAEKHVCSAHNGKALPVAHNGSCSSARVRPAGWHGTSCLVFYEILNSSIFWKQIDPKWSKELKRKRAHRPANARVVSGRPIYHGCAYIMRWGPRARTTHPA